jgi:hypothetical protein
LKYTTQLTKDVEKKALSFIRSGKFVWCVKYFRMTEDTAT